MTQVTNADQEWLGVSGWATTIGVALPCAGKGSSVESEERWRLTKEANRPYCCGNLAAELFEDTSAQR